MHCFYSNVQIYVFGLNLITELGFFLSYSSNYVYLMNVLDIMSMLGAVRRHLVLSQNHT